MNGIRGAASLILRIFFRHVSVAGSERVPLTAPVILVLNHPNALVDPLLLLACTPRRLVWLAKEPLFRMPVIGTLVRMAGAIPVYRRQDAGDTSRNREMFSRAHEVLAHGGAIALFPEGASHSDPQMRPLRTGAARMALGVSAGGGGLAVQVVPTGLYYTAKATFRSSALVVFGAPLAVEPTGLDAHGEPPPDAVRRLTERIASALSDVTLQADRQEAVELATRAEQIFSEAPGSADAERIEEHFMLRRRFLAGYAWLHERSPERVERLTRRILAYGARLDAAGLTTGDVSERASRGPELVRRALAALLPALPLALPALPGLVVHYPAYRLVGPVATSLAGERDVVATAKILAAAVAFPLTWLVVAVIVGHRFGGWWGLAAFAVTPVCGYLALRFLERLDPTLGAWRALLLLAGQPLAYRRLEAERRRIRGEILSLAAETPATVTGGAE